MPSSGANFKPERVPRPREARGATKTTTTTTTTLPQKPQPARKSSYTDHSGFKNWLHYQLHLHEQTKPDTPLTRRGLVRYLQSSSGKIPPELDPGDLIRLDQLVGAVLRERRKQTEGSAPTAAAPSSTPVDASTTVADCSAPPDGGRSSTPVAASTRSPTPVAASTRSPTPVAASTRSSTPMAVSATISPENDHPALVSWLNRQAKLYESSCPESAPPSIRGFGRRIQSLRIPAEFNPKDGQLLKCLARDVMRKRKSNLAPPPAPSSPLSSPLPLQQQIPKSFIAPDPTLTPPELTALTAWLHDQATLHESLTPNISLTPRRFLELLEFSWGGIPPELDPGNRKLAQQASWVLRERRRQREQRTADVIPAVPSPLHSEATATPSRAASPSIDLDAPTPPPRHVGHRKNQPSSPSCVVVEDSDPGSSQHGARELRAGPHGNAEVDGDAVSSPPPPPCPSLQTPWDAPLPPESSVAPVDIWDLPLLEGGGDSYPLALSGFGYEFQRWIPGAREGGVGNTPTSTTTTTAINHKTGLKEDTLSSLIDLDFSTKPLTPEPLLDWAEEVNSPKLGASGDSSLL